MEPLNKIIISKSYRWKTDIQRILTNLHKVTLQVQLGLELRPWLRGPVPECYATF